MRNVQLQPQVKAQIGDAELNAIARRAQCGREPQPTATVKALFDAKYGFAGVRPLGLAYIVGMPTMPHSHKYKRSTSSSLLRGLLATHLWSGRIAENPLGARTSTAPLILSALVVTRQLKAKLLTAEGDTANAQ